MCKPPTPPQDLSLSRTIATGKSWVTAVRYMPVFKALAVTTFARSVTLYDITSPFCSVCGAIPKMDFTPMSMDVLPCRGEPKSQLVVIGDSGGLVHVHKLVPRASGEAFQARCSPFEHAQQRVHQCGCERTGHVRRTAGRWTARRGGQRRLTGTARSSCGAR